MFAFLCFSDEVVVINLKVSMEFKIQCVIILFDKNMIRSIFTWWGTYVNTTI